MELLEVSLADVKEPHPSLREENQAASRSDSGLSMLDDLLRIDRFGETVMRESLDELLSSLPQPKTLITDIYIVDHFPSLADLGFEATRYPEKAAREALFQ